MEEIIFIINTVLKNRGKKTKADNDESCHLRNDLGFDSLDLAELTVRIEAKFNVDIFEDGIVSTVGDIVKKIG